MASSQYNLTPIDRDALFRLLPFIVRASDPRGSIQAFMEGTAEQHNYFLEKLKNLPRLQDPTKAGIFDPAALGENPEEFATYKELVTSPLVLTDEEQSHLDQLKTTLRRSIAAEALEKDVLALLSDTVGADLHNRFESNTNRELIQTAVYRHHIKGTHGSVYVLGRILGFLDLKVRELWTRFAIKDPMYPLAGRNDDDFAAEPEERPYWPQTLDHTYDGDTTLFTERADGTGAASTTSDEERQTPAASPSYDATVLDDGPDYTLLFEQLTTDPNDQGFWTSAVNQHNPWGNFLAEVTSRPILGTYYLASGSALGRAFVEIPLANATVAKFEAIADGEWANGVELSITTDTGGRQKLQFTGPQSKIKFKSSYFDLSLAADILVLSQLIKAGPVEPNPSASFIDPTLSPVVASITSVHGDYLGPEIPRVVLDDIGDLTVSSFVTVAGVTSINGLRMVVEVLPELSSVVLKALPGESMTYTNDWAPGATLTYGRVAGDYAVTGNAAGDDIIADPDVNFAINFKVYMELIATLREFFEKIRPITRTPRNENFGFMLRDNFLYAPVFSLNEVVLQSDVSSNKYKLVVDNTGLISWELTTDSVTAVTQVDNTIRRVYTWGLTEVSGAPVFVPTLVATTTEAVSTTVVYVRQDAFTGFVYLESGQLLASFSSPENIVDSIHGDGTTDESGDLGDNKVLYHEDLSAVAEVMSADAVTTDTPDPRFLFQTSPEDDLTIIRTTVDDIRTFLGPYFTDPQILDGYISVDANWSYLTNAEGAFEGRDVRHRSTGPDPGVVEPIPTGDAGRLDGLYHNYPVHYVNYFGRYIWRSRTDNKAYRTEYNYNSPSAGVGGETIHTEIEEDGGIEGGFFLNNPTPIPISTEGFGVTPNQQTFEGPNLDQVWHSEDVHTIELPSPNFTSTSAHGTGETKLRIARRGDLYPGSIIHVLTGLYSGVHQVREVIEISSVAYDVVLLGVSHIGVSAAQFNVVACSLQDWDNSLAVHTATVTAASANPTVNSATAFVTDGADIYDTMTVPVPADPPTSPQTYAISASFEQDMSAISGDLFLEIRGSGRFKCSLKRAATDRPIVTEAVAAGHFLWGGGERTSLEVTFLLSVGDRFGDFSVNTDNGFVTIDGLASWRGGPWRGVSGWTVDDRSADGLPGILTKDDGSFPT